MPSIKKELFNGVFWIAIAKYAGIVISLGVTAILARNISPAAFGTIAVATVIMTFLDIFVDIGIGPAIVQFKNLSERQINSLFMVGCYVGLFLTLLLFLLASPIANFYKDPNLVNICRLLSVCLLFKSLNIVPNGLMMKNKRFRTVAIRNFVFHVICGSLAAFAALQGWGVYALIITPILSSIGVWIVNFYNYPQKLLFNIDFSAIKEVWTYSSYQLLFYISNYFSRNLDKLIVGKYLSISDLGYYDKSYRLMLLPVQNITFVISPVLHPVLSTLQDDKIGLEDKNRKLSVFMANISFPIGIILYFCAKEIIDIIFGPNWEPSIPVFQILALSLPLQMILSTSGSLYQAAGKTKHMFISGLLCSVCTVVGFILATRLFRTLISMAWAWDLTLMGNFGICYYIMYKHTFGASLCNYLMAFIPQCLNSIIVVIISIVAFTLMPINNVFLSLTYKISIISIITVTLAYLLHQYDIFSLAVNSWKRIMLKRHQE